MKVVFVIPYFYPAWQYGGSPRAAFEYATALVQRGHSITVLTTDSMGMERRPSANEAEPVDVGGIQVYYYRNLSNRLAFRQRFFWPRQLFKDLPLRLKGADVVHIHELRSSLSVAAYQAATHSRVAYVLSAHGGLRRLGKRIPKVIYDRFWGNRIIQGAAAVVVLSDSEAQAARDFQVHADRVVQLPNSASAAFVSERPSRGSFRKQWRLGDRRIVAFLGRLHPIKGADILLRAFARLIDSDDNVHLVIAGPDDGQEKELRRIAAAECSGRVAFTGYMDSRARAELFADADLLVIPSRSEAFPVTVLEALLSQLPVLLSDSCDLVRIFKPAHGVDSFRSEDAGDLCSRMRSILASNSLRIAVDNGRALVQQEYSSERVGSALERLYSSIVRREVTA